MEIIEISGMILNNYHQLFLHKTFTVHLLHKLEFQDYKLRIFIIHLISQKLQKYTCSNRAKRKK